MTAVSGAYGVVMVAQVVVIRRIFEDGWSFGVGIAAFCVTSVSVVVLRALAHSWKSAIGKTTAMVAYLSVFMWWMSRHDGWSGFPVLLIAALLFGYVLPSIGGRRAQSIGREVE